MGSIQKEVHRIVDSVIPQGWSSQISNGGEPTFLYSLQQTTRLLGGNGSDGASKTDPVTIEVVTTRGVTLGYYSSVQGNLSARLGRITSPFWINYGPIYSVTPRVHRYKNPDKSILKKQVAAENGTKLMPNDAYLFLSAGVDLVLYSTLLQGQFRRNAYEIAASDVERLVPHLAMGVVFDLGRIQLSFSHTFREREIKGGKGHRWSNLSVAFLYD